VGGLYYRENNVDTAVITCKGPVRISECAVFISPYLLTYSMEQSPSWEVNWFVASQEIPRVLWNPKVFYCIHKRPPPVPILSQPNPVHTPTSHLPKVHPNIIIPSTPGSPQLSLSLRFPHQNPVHTSPLPHTRYMPRPSHSSRFYHTNEMYSFHLTLRNNWIISEEENLRASKMSLKFPDLLLFNKTLNAMKHKQ
jgi:hypothetical protein